MSRVFVVLHKQGEYEFPHVFLSRTKASNFVYNNMAADKEAGETNSQYRTIVSEIVDANEETYVKLQRQLSRVANRLGKARSSLKATRRAYEDLLELFWKNIGVSNEDINLPFQQDNVKDAAE